MPPRRTPWPADGIARAATRATRRSSALWRAHHARPVSVLSARSGARSSCTPNTVRDAASRDRRRQISVRRVSQRALQLGIQTGNRRLVRCAHAHTTQATQGQGPRKLIGDHPRRQDGGGRCAPRCDASDRTGILQLRRRAQRPASCNTTANDFVSPINTVWVLVTAFLVFFMQAGFMGLEAGFARSRETVNVLMECVFDTCLCGLLYWAIGFAFQFGNGNGFIGHQYFFLHGMTPAYGDHECRVPGVLPVPVRVRRHRVDRHVGRHGRPHRLQGRHPLQHLRVRASSTRSSATGSGARAAGSSNSMRLVFKRVRTGGAFFRDFAGSTVVHTVGGMIALAGAIALGPRLGRTFKRDGGGPMPRPRPHVGRHRRRDPVVRLVRVQPRLDAVGHGLAGHRPGRRRTPRSRPVPAA